MSRKGPFELRLLGSFSCCSQILSPCPLLLSQMLKACQPLISSLSICWKGWLPLPYSNTLVICLIPPAAKACQQRWEENRAPGLSFQPALALHAKPPGAGPCCPSANKPAAPGRGLGECRGHGKIGRLSTVPEQRGKADSCQPAVWRDVVWQPAVSQGIQLQGEQSQECVLHEAPWQSACVLHGTVPAAAVGNRAALSHTQPGLFCLCRLPGGTGWAWPGAAHSRANSSSAQVGHRLALHIHCAACCDCQLPLTSACPPLPVCYGFQDFCFHKLLIFSLMNNNAKKLGRNAHISLSTYLWILVYASLPISKQ